MFETQLADNSLVIILFIAVVFVLMRGVKVVPQAENWVVERLGKYNSTLEGGLNFIIPFIDDVRVKYNMQEQTIDIPSQRVITKDNVSIFIDGLVFIRITDAEAATYSALDVKQMISQLCQTTLRSEIGSLELDETLSSRDDLNASLMQALNNASNEWGVKVTRVEVSDISVPEEVQKAMELQLQATRERRAIETKAQAEKNAVIADAEALKQKAFLEAEALERTADAERYQQEQIGIGQQLAIEAVNKAMQENPQAAEYLLAKDRVKAFSGLAASDSSNKIVIPVETSELLGSMSLLQGLLKQDK
ncbi:MULTISPECIES: SPFH domain-containing protein [Thiomicrorhabdus]|uniref:SPFH/Band 7/PHB domain protein n=1 Tax=Thiomicrorhabdus heinhorstiae TaxID=2748010 RepID=A0ABS0BUK8_9GAMM|nr:MULTISPECIES: SPFH domain-containing protein [Thiomicrorhabdus]MBF6057521.1 SPFH/Band 7/PHB domain protein [Thiomicrorhabdus heinhorstiae]